MDRGYNDGNSYKLVVLLISDILMAAWWIYILIMSPSMLFSGGVYEFFLGLFATVILLALPMVFHKE